MAFKTFGPVPFKPLEVIDCDTALDEERISNLLGRRCGKVSLLIRSESGAPQRGGFFFHLTQGDAGAITFHDFDGGAIVTLSPGEATRLINHSSGRAFDAEMLALCQSKINLRQDR